MKYKIKKQIEDQTFMTLKEWKLNKMKDVLNVDFNEVYEEAKKLKIVFGDVNNEYVDILVDSVYFNKLTIIQLREAVLFVIDNCTRQKPSIAEIIHHRYRNIKN
jgi:hypothetical protein